MSATRSALARPHVLVVSDDDDLRSFLTEGLVYGGFWTSSIATGIQTLEVLRLRSFDLILIDAGLSDLSVFEVLRRLRGRSNRSRESAARTDVPILLIAGGLNEVDEGDAVRSGADGVLVAPLDLDEIVPMLHQVVEIWRSNHPDRPWADEASMGTTATSQ